MEWEHRCPEMTGVGRNSNLGPSPDDTQFIEAWRQARIETRELLDGWGWYVEVVCDRATQVFDARPDDEWTDAEIVGWRRWLLRSHRISHYGDLLGAHYLDVGGGRPKDLHTLPIPNPPASSLPTRRGRSGSGSWCALMSSRITDWTTRGGSPRRTNWKANSDFGNKKNRPAGRSRRTVVEGAGGARGRRGGAGPG